MSARSLKNRKLRGAGYIRMSTDDQKDSPQRQRGLLKDLAARENVEIVAWYEDHGKTGTESSKRNSFQRMLKDAQGRRFDVVLLSEQSRFSREDHFQIFEHWSKLRDAGVGLITCQKRLTDWNDMGAILPAFIEQFSCHDESRKISDRSVSGKRQKLQSKTAVACGAFGYDREILDHEGKVVRRVHFRDQFTKPINWRSRLVPSDDTKAVDAVRYAFTALRAGASLRAITRELNNRGITTSKGKGGRKDGSGNHWRPCVVKQMLTNPIYIGTLRAGVTSGAKVFNRLADPEHGPYIIENSHEPLIDEATFYQVQSLLKTTRTKRHCDERTYLLSGKIIAEPCGCKMFGHFNGDRFKASYECTVSSFGGLPQGGHTSIRCEAIDAAVLNIIRNELARPEMARELRAAIALYTAEPESNFAVEENRLQRMEDTIARTEDTLFNSLGEASQQTLKAMSARLEKLRAERDALADSIELRRNTTRLNPITASLLHDLQKLLANIQDASPEHARRAIEAVVTKVVVRRTLVAGSVPRVIAKREGKPTNQQFSFYTVSGCVEFREGIFSRDAFEFTDADLYPDKLRNRVGRFVLNAGRKVTTSEVYKALEIQEISAHRALKHCQLEGTVTRVGETNGKSGGWMAAATLQSQRRTKAAVG